MIYKIKIRPKALKLRIYQAIYNLPNGDVKKLAGCKSDFRLRVGNYRIIYQINNEELIILITKADTRGQIYK